jgi:hypothetical protein
VRLLQHRELHDVTYAEGTALHFLGLLAYFLPIRLVAPAGDSGLKIHSALVSCKATSVWTCFHLFGITPAFPGLIRRRQIIVSEV